MTYTLCFNTNAFCCIEGETGKPFNETLARLAPGKFMLSAARMTLWAGLREHHPDVTLKQAGEMLSPDNTAKILLAVSDAISAAFPEESGKSRPQKEAGGTG